MLAGFVAGEGCFTVSRTGTTFRDGSSRLKFSFQVAVASRDRAMLEALRVVLGCGSIRDAPPAKAHWQPGSAFAVNSHRAHRQFTIPFMDRYLLPCAKRRQFEMWRAALDEYERLHPNRYGRGPSPCSEPGCDEPVRGRGLCRRHYYRATGY